MTRPIRLAVTTMALVLLAGAAACGDDRADPQAAAPTAAAAPTSSASVPTTSAVPEAVYPVTVTGANGEVTITAPPASIVSLSPSLTEIVFAIGAGDQVVAVDDQSNFPSEAPVTDLSGFEPNVEAIADRQPDLVVVSDDINNVVSGLNALDIPVIQLPAAVTIDDTYAQIELVGAATGHPAEAAALVADMRSRIEAIVSSTPAPAQPLTYYHELDNTLFSVTSKTFIGEVYGAFGLVNIADEADTDGFGYPQLSAEYLLEQDPALIFLADTKCCAETAATAAARPGWSELQAVKNGTVIELDDDIASRWGPRIVELHEAIATAISLVPVA
jgi:iron complex transport system substrate-binding protein